MPSNGTLVLPVLTWPEKIKGVDYRGIDCGFGRHDTAVDGGRLGSVW